jgi:hypothetical protein
MRRREKLARPLPSLLTLALALLLPLGAGCGSGPAAQPNERSAAGGGEEISRERAIELAREHVRFEPRSVEAVKTTEQERPVWEVTFKGRPPEEGGIGEVMIVVLDRRTGEMVSLGMS